MSRIHRLRESMEIDTLNDLLRKEGLPLCKSLRLNGHCLSVYFSKKEKRRFMILGDEEIADFLDGNQRRNMLRKYVIPRLRELLTEIKDIKLSVTKGE